MEMLLDFNKNKFCDNCSDIQKKMLSAKLDPHKLLSTTYTLLKEEYSEGKIVLCISDNNFENLMDEVAEEKQYTYNTYLKCPKCNKYYYLGICIRGTPIYKIMDTPPDEKEFVHMAMRDKKTIYR